ncbi:MAG: hypothetical protein HYW23_01705 [Candidatus Aenigmarchaeota archaeon]|nr:hypothetical protein [Candidatus Aenigmarchaeota archaeon]
MSISTREDVIRASDYIKALNLISGSLYEFAYHRNKQEVSLTVHRRFEPAGYVKLGLYFGERHRGKVIHTTPLMRGGKIVSYPLIVAHTHTNGFQKPSMTDLDQLIAMTERVQNYVPNAKPLSIIVTYGGSHAQATIVQAKKIRDVNLPNLKWLRYEFKEESIQISPKPHEFCHDKLTLEDAFKQFEFGV